MSILIRGMEMPKSCSNCNWSRYSFPNAWCFMTYHKVDIEVAKNGRPDDCPLIPVPPHGRLIDASEKIKVQIYDDMTEDYHMVEMTIDDLLSQGWIEANAPTIIEAEEGE